MKNPRKKKGKSLPLNNLFLFLLCFVLAILSWHGIRKNLGLEISVPNVKLDYEIPEGWALMEKSADHVDILFRGSREDIRDLNNTQLRIRIPIKNPVAGQEIRIPLTEDLLQNPTSAHPIHFLPAEIVLRLDEKTERTLPVKATVLGKLPEEYQLDKIVCTPATVRVYGPKQTLEPLQTVHTESVNLAGRTASFSANLQVILPPESHLKADPEWVSASLSVVQHTQTKEFPRIPIYTLCAPGETRQILVHPKNVTLIVSASSYQIEQLRPSDLFVFVDCSDLNETTTYTLLPTPYLPNGVKFVKTLPASIQVEVKAP